ncbi:sodium-coupled monocarboxylate transporter 2 [Rhipicephalus sanguineus]|uniref:sodium-coupled monocarboxylate transporter 2 n=1 Tax=Rhipicephalus sanguineus TaxID=34632 RepID=UPI001893996D|nr:sodium-coupled monocarboxylate transporter 2 [Rhipicephalus sanguineus]
MSAVNVEHVTFGVLMAANLGLGLYFAFSRRARKASTADEVFLGSRSMGTLPLAVSVLASMISAIGVIGFGAHYYAHGFHYAWSLVSAPLLVPVVTLVVIPVLYKLRVTSVFEYLRLRYGNKVGLGACAIYLFLSQTIGAVALFSASVAAATVFHLPIQWTTLGIGVAGTVYTALGGLRGVVWTDCVQAFLILMAPVTVIGKIIYDSRRTDVLLRPLSDINMKEYAFRMNLDFTNDENFWACFLGLLVHNLLRTGIDQSVVQRYMASRTIKEAQRTMCIGVFLNIIYMIVIGVMAMALIYWFRDCDPLLTGEIKKYDEILPYYVKQHLFSFPCFSGLFLTGVVSAATSTISSIINSQAAVCYMDVVSMFVKLEDHTASHFTKGLAFLFGILMTIYSMIVPYLGSAVRVVVVMHNGASGPFVGMFLLAFLFPWANSKGVVAGTLLTTALQFWQMFGKIYYGIRAPMMPVSTDYCPANSTMTIDAMRTSSYSAAHSNADVFPLYRFSSNWGVLASAGLTILIGLVVSLLTGGREVNEKHTQLTSDIFVSLWRKLGLLPRYEKAKIAEILPIDDDDSTSDTKTTLTLLGNESFV